MLDRLKWHYYEWKRWQRLANPEPSVRRLIDVTGRWWMIFHGVRREYQIRLWDNYRWYSPDFCVPRHKVIVEADGGPHFTSAGKSRDYIRDFRLAEHGWKVLRVTTGEMRQDPAGVRRKVRQHLNGR